MRPAMRPALRPSPGGKEWRGVVEHEEYEEALEKEGDFEAFGTELVRRAPGGFEAFGKKKP